MSSESSEQGPQGSSGIIVRVELDVLDEAARRRAEEVIQKALDEELANQPLPERTRTIITVGRISRS